MADVKTSAETPDIAPDGRHKVYGINEVPSSVSFLLPDLNLIPERMVNGKISVTVASNDITVALKTLSGNNPSTTDPVGIWINGSYRRCTAALSVTKADGTNWFNSGSAELGTQTVGYFVYLIWNTTPATDIMDIGFSRIPYGRVYSDFSGTTTNGKYLAFANASTPTSTDDVVNIGYFEATLSLTGTGHLWTVPTFTNANLIQFPTYETPWLTYVPTITGYSANPTNVVYRYQMRGRNCIVQIAETTGGTSNATTKTYTAPFTTKTISNMFWNGTMLFPHNNGANVAAGFLQIASASNSIGAFLSTAANWTASGTAMIRQAEITFEV
jgi:hypothetical protein